ncbi:MAG: hypothetical protein E7322_10235 [Clostridiales bacterium]|nr:hypothetical protein [Clostridiales bacterium]
MEKIFPSTTSKPEKIKVFALIPSWIWVFVLFPMFMPFIGLGLWEQTELSVWLEISYHVANGLLMLWLMFSYFKEEWFMVSTALSHYLKHIALTAGLAVGAEVVLLGALHLFGFDITGMLEWLPVVEMTISQTPRLLIDTEPIYGAIAVSVFAPISICALFYCLGFAPVCYKKPFLAYLCIAVITLIPPIIDILWRGQAEFVLISYLVRLPIHLLICWSYQKTDNVWTPLISLAAVNLLTSIAMSVVPF